MPRMTAGASSNTRGRLLALARWPLLLALVAAFAGLAGASAAKLSLTHIDGAYQTLAMLRHIDAGDWPGRDFLPYLGAAIPSLLWPSYQLAGGTLWASQATAIFAGLLITFSGGALLSALALRAIGLRRAEWFALAGGGLATVLTLPTPATVHSLVLPGASLYSMRSAATYLVAVLVVVAARRGRWSVVVSAIGSGCLLLWSNDYAWTSVLALHVALVAHFAGRVPTSRLFRATAISLLGGALIYLVLVTLLTSGAPLSLWRFNFLAVAADQYWYYPPYSRDSHYFEPLDLLRYWQRDDAGLSATLVLAPFVAIGCLDRRLRKCLPVIALAAALWTAFASGLLSEVGGHKNAGYHQMTAQVLPFVLIAALLRATQWPAALQTFAQATTRRLRPVAEPTIAVLMLSCIVTIALGSREHMAQLAVDPRLRLEPTLGGYVPRAYVDELARLRAQVGPGGRGANTASAYLTPYAIVLDHAQVPPVDSVIHALGYLREPFVAALRTPTTRFAVTSNGDSNHTLEARFAQWNVHQDWAYFGTLAQLYKPAFTGSRAILWQRRTTAVPHRQVATCDVTQGRVSATIGVVDQRVGNAYELGIRYRLECDSPLLHRRALAVASVPYDSWAFGGQYSLRPPPLGAEHSARLLHVPRNARRATRLLALPVESCRVIVSACSAARLPHVDAALLQAFGVRVAPPASEAAVR